MDRLLNAVKGHHARQLGQLAQPRFATVSSYDGTRHMAKVLLQPDGLLTGWLPIAVAGAGAGVGVLSAPDAGQQCLVIPQEGDGEHWIVAGFVHTQQSGVVPGIPNAVGGTDPVPLSPGETAIVGPGGCFVRLSADGTVQVRGDLHVSGEVFDRHGSLDRLRQNYDAHRHTNVQNGGGTSGPTDHADPE